MITSSAFDVGLKILDQLLNGRKAIRCFLITCMPMITFSRMGT